MFVFLSQMLFDAKKKMEAWKRIKTCKTQKKNEISKSEDPKTSWTKVEQGA